MSELQRIVDTLSKRVDRAAAIDDKSLQLLVYSSHETATVDRVRTESILWRHAPEDARKWFLSLGVQNATGPVRVPVNPDLDMKARLCTPIRCQDILFGYLLLIDEDETLGEDAFEAAAKAADAAGTIMWREQLLHELERGRERELVRDLLATDATLHDRAADDLVESNVFAPGTPVQVLVVRPTMGDDNLDDRVAMAVGAALDQIRRSLSARHALHLVRPDHALLIVSPKDPALLDGDARALAATVHEAIARVLDRSLTWKGLIGIGHVARALRDAHVSYGQARDAVRVAGIVGSFGNIADWNQLGIYRMLSQFPVEQLSSEMLHPGLVTLFAQQGGAPLVETLECYLDNGCDVKETAAQLFLHRASLYYRLHRMEEIAGVSLADGEDRLALHLGLKLARLAGIHPGGKVTSLRTR